MIRHYLRVAFRHLARHRGLTAINVIGLSLGLACLMSILLFVQDELSYDRWSPDSDRIYRVVKDFVNSDGSRTPDATTPPGLMPALLRGVPEMEAVARIFPPWGSKTLLSAGTKAFYEPDYLRADSSVFTLFTFEFLRGDPRTALAHPGSIVLTEALARKYFGDEEPVGKTMLFEQRHPLQVTAVIRDLPAQSHFKAGFLISLRTLSRDFQANYAMDTQWGWYNFYTYIKVRPGTDPAAVEQKIRAVFKAHQPENDNWYYIQPLAGIDGIHLNSHLKWELQPNSDRLYIYVFLTVALFVLVIAGVNYVNLTTARSSLRAKEVGIRKVSGAARPALMAQFLGESLIQAVIAALAAVGLTEISLPFLNAITGKDLSLVDPGRGLFWLLIGAVTVMFGLAAGLVPAVSLSSLNPVRAFRGRMEAGRRTLDFRRVLVAFQFILSTILITGIIVVQQQVAFLQHARLGFDKDHVVVIRNVAALPDRGEGVRTTLAQLPGVERIAGCDGMIGGQNWTNSLRLKGSQNGQLVNFLSVGYDFLEVLNIELREGRNFSRAFPRDSVDAIILNETAVRQLGVPEPVVGRQIVWSESPDTTIYATVIGVARDFHFASLRDEIRPFAFVYTPSRAWLMAARISSQDVHGTLAQMEQAWTAMVPGRPFDFYFLDQTIDELYRFERNFRAVFSLMTGLCLLIACLGLFGLAAHAVERRTKEVGIRKVLGASTTGIARLLTGELLGLVALANVIAIPVAWFIMQRWLETFPYRVGLAWWVFLAAGGAALMIALATVSMQAVKAALMNPVHALRYE